MLIAISKECLSVAYLVRFTVVI